MSDQEARQRLHKASFMGRDVKVRQMLESEQYKVSAKLPDGETALHAAVAGGKLSTALLLLDFDADINAQNKMGETPLHYASMNALDVIVTTLLNKQADFTIMNRAGQFPIDLAGTDMTHHILSSKEASVETQYSTFMRLLLQRPHHLLVALSDNLILDERFTRGQREVITHSILHLFEWKNQALGLIKWAIYREVGKTLDDSTLFRSDSFATRLMGGFTKLFGKEYMRNALADPVRRLISFQGSLEIDPVKCGPDKVDENVQNLLTVVKMFLDHILASMKSCPLSIRKICSFLKQSVGLRFPNSKYIAVGGFVFLRFFSAGVMTPEQYGIIENPPSPLARRGLILVAKIIQNLSNNAEFGGKEAYMIPCNPFVEANMGHFRHFLDQISTIPQDASAQTSTIPTWRFSVSRALFHLHSHLVHNIRGIGLHLGVEKEMVEEKVRQLESFTKVEVAADLIPIAKRAADAEKENNADSEELGSPRSDSGGGEEEDNPEGAVAEPEVVDPEIARSNEFQKQKIRVVDSIRSVVVDLQKLQRQLELCHSFEESLSAARLMKSLRTVLETPAVNLRTLNLPAMRVTRPDFQRDAQLTPLTEQKMNALRKASLDLFAPFNAHFRTLMEQLNKTEALEVISLVRGRVSIFKQLLQHYWGLETVDQRVSAGSQDRLFRQMVNTISVVQDQLRTLRDELEATNAIEIAVAVATLLRNTKRILEAPAGVNFRMSQYEVERPNNPQEIPANNVQLMKKISVLRQMCDMLLQEIRKNLDAVVRALEANEVTDHEKSVVSRAGIVRELLDSFLNPEETMERKDTDAKSKVKTQKEQQSTFNQLVKFLMEMGPPREVDLNVTKSQSR